ncbi:MAG: nucleotidyltransferase substrate binding protein [Deltaproteobacteria bacterium]|nr:nucleotidyltransferase substrate binding protein [Deltaproteobacteria bacterium]
MVSIPLNLSQLKRALESLKKSIDQPKDEFTRDSTIQRFEYSFELSWKTLKRYFSLNQGLDESNVKNLFREAGKQKLIDSIDSWFEYLRARNLTSHTYNENTAEEVYKAACRFFVDAKELLTRLEKLVD